MFSRIGAMKKPFVLTLLFVGLFAIPADDVGAGAYVIAGKQSFSVDIIMHPMGYTGTGGVLNISFGIDPTSANAAAMVIPLQNCVNIFNGLQVTSTNIASGVNTNITTGFVDFESVLLHEMGHSMGLAHVNAATESELPSADFNYTKATKGVNGVFNIAAGVDGIKGSSDDVRGDDVNLYWFRKSDNSPVGALGATIDATTYSRSLADLPSGLYAANSDFTVSNALGSPNIEGIMQQGTFTNESQRTMIPEGVASFRLGMSGADEIQGNADDYTFTITSLGLSAAADIVIDFDNGQTGFAVSKSFLSSFATDHWRVTSSNIFFNTGSSWFFNTVSNAFTSSSLHVDFSATTNGTGGTLTPFNNMTDSILNVSTSGTLNIASGSASDTFTGGNALSKAMTLVNSSPGSGSVFIGN